MTSTWQERATLEMNELADRADKLRTFLISGPALDPQVLALMRAQYAGMVAYHDALVARLRLTGVIDVETPPLVRESKALETGTPAAAEVTVTVPAGKRAHVSLGSMGHSARSSWTVTEGQRQTWSVAPGEFVTVHEDEPHSTVAHKREDG